MGNIGSNLANTANYFGQTANIAQNVFTAGNLPQPFTGFAPLAGDFANLGAQDLTKYGGYFSNLGFSNLSTALNAFDYKNPQSYFDTFNAGLLDTANNISVGG